MKASEAVGYVQHIASLGLGQRVAIAEMMKALEDVVPSRVNPFFWTDCRGIVVDAYVEALEPGVGATMVETRYNTPDDVPTFDRLLLGGRSHNNVERLKSLPGWNRSTLHQVLLKDYDALGCVDFVLSDPSGLRGFFALSRSHRDPPFAHQEIRRVRALVPHFLHAINAGDGVAGSADTTPSTRVGFVVADAHGEVVGFAGNGRELMLRLHNRPVDGWFSPTELAKQVPPGARLVIDRLRQVRNGHPGDPATLIASTRWGDFRVSAYPVEPAPVGGGERFMVAIAPLIDRRVERARLLARTNLTQAEKRVAMRMAEQGSGDELARDLGLSTGSYRQYAKRIYSLLGVEGRLGLKAFLDG